MNEDHDLFTGLRPVGPNSALRERVLATASGALAQPSVPAAESWWPEVGLLAAALLLLAVNLSVGGGRQFRVEEASAALDPLEQREFRAAGLAEFACGLTRSERGRNGDVWRQIGLEQL